jgi:phosphoribosylpyrophosphate synthetase
MQSFYLPQWLFLCHSHSSHSSLSKLTKEPHHDIQVYLIVAPNINTIKINKYLSYITYLNFTIIKNYRNDLKQLTI